MKIIILIFNLIFKYNLYTYWYIHKTFDFRNFRNLISDVKTIQKIYKNVG